MLNSYIATCANLRLHSCVELNYFFVLTSIPACQKTLRAGKMLRYIDFKHHKIGAHLNVSYMYNDLGELLKIDTPDDPPARERDLALTTSIFEDHGIGIDVEPPWNEAIFDELTDYEGGEEARINNLLGILGCGGPAPPPVVPAVRKPDIGIGSGLDHGNVRRAGWPDSLEEMVEVVPVTKNNPISPQTALKHFRNLSKNGGVRPPKMLQVFVPNLRKQSVSNFEEEEDGSSSGTGGNAGQVTAHAVGQPTVPYPHGTGGSCIKHPLS